MQPKLIDDNGNKTVLGKLKDLINNGVDTVSVDLGKSYESLIDDFWSQEFDDDKDDTK